MVPKNLSSQDFEAIEAKGCEGRLVLRLEGVRRLPNSGQEVRKHKNAEQLVLYGNCTKFHVMVEVRDLQWRVMVLQQDTGVNSEME